MDLSSRAGIPVRLFLIRMPEFAVSKAFTKESDDGEDPEFFRQLPHGQKNYITPAGYQRLKDEIEQLWKVERPALVQTVAWAASNGDRSENGDYIYGKKRLREIDRRIRFLSKRMDDAVVVDPEQRAGCEQVFFGATVTVCGRDGAERTYSIVGVDEADAGCGLISWISPLARVLLKTRVDDVVLLQVSGEVEELEVTEVAYLPIHLPDRI